METKIALKFVVILLACFISLLFLGFAFKTFSVISPDILSQTNQGIKAGLLIFIAIFITAFSYILVSFITTTKVRLIPFFIVSFIGYILGFALGQSLPNQVAVSSISALFISLGLFKMVLYIRLEYLNCIKPKLAIIIPKNIHSFLVILGLILSINFYIFLIASAKDSSFKIPERFLNKAMEPAIKIIENNLEAQINTQLQNSLGQVINTQDREATLKFIRAELEETFSEGSTRQQLGFNQDVINPKDITLTPEGKVDIKPVVENLKPTLLKQVNKALEPYTKYIPILLAFSLFFILESVFSIFPFLIVPFISLNFVLLKKLKFIKLIKSTAEVERYSL